ncbi:MAG TPA: hypothetical protein VFE63_05025 [Roseiarcus sp.]|nr:hypothetical protein [Roseiarcus sp.]
MITSTSDKHFLHVNVLLRHARAESGGSERDLETILTEAATGKRRLWVSSILFAELRPSAFVPGPFLTLHEFVRYLRSIATFVTPDPNTMLRAGRLRDVKWQRPAALRRPEEKPRFLSMIDAIQLASALWVKEAAGVADLEFLAFDDRSADDAEDGAGLSLLRLQDYTDDMAIDSDGLAAVQLARAEPVLQHALRQSVPVG